MPEIQDDPTLYLHWNEILDGEEIVLTQYDSDGEVDGQVRFTREVAIELSKNLLKHYEEI